MINIFFKGGNCTVDNLNTSSRSVKRIFSEMEPPNMAAEDPRVASSQPAAVLNGQVTEISVDKVSIADFFISQYEPPV